MKPNRIVALTSLPAIAMAALILFSAPISQVRQVPQARQAPHTRQARRVRQAPLAPQVPQARQVLQARQAPQIGQAPQGTPARQAPQQVLPTLQLLPTYPVQLTPLAPGIQRTNKSYPDRLLQPKGTSQFISPDANASQTFLKDDSTSQSKSDSLDEPPKE